MTERAFVLECVHGEKLTREHGLDEEHARRLARQLFRAYMH